MRDAGTYESDEEIESSGYTIEDAETEDDSLLLTDLGDDSDEEFFDEEEEI